MRTLRLGDALQKLEAEGDDVVFLDFMSLPQEDKMGRLMEANFPWPGAPKRSAAADAYFEVSTRVVLGWY